MKKEQTYIDKLKALVYNHISEDINENTIEKIVDIDLVRSHIEDVKSANFQSYYFETLNNEEHFFQTDNFFKKFKKEYALQGIDNNFLDKLESRKKSVLNDIRGDKLVKLYFENFHKVLIKHGKGLKEKDLGSFFTKLIHTFQPNEYCALDNPIKNYFKLEKESFFLSFLIISAEYKHWATDNRKFIQEIKTRFKQMDKQGIIEHERITDLKLLDLIFWSKANRKWKESTT